MMRFFNLLLLLFISCSLDAQSVLSTAGQFDERDTQVQWTIGEITVQSYESAEYSVEEGFNFAAYTGPSFVWDQTESEQMYVFPNPTTEWLRFDDKIAPCDWMIIDVHGKIVLSAEQSLAGDINVRSLTPGIYLFQLIDHQGLHYHSTFFKSR